MNSGTWDVVVTVKASREAVERFVSRYRRLGARCIRIYYDSPNHAFALPGDDLVQTICDAGYWGLDRPPGIEKRQVVNATRALHRTDAEWLLHCDIDEHLWSEHSISDQLAGLPDSALSALVLPVEAIYDVMPQCEQDIYGARHFKMLTNSRRDGRRFWRKRYKQLNKLTNAGYWAHIVGKSFTRVAVRGRILGIPLHSYSIEIGLAGMLGEKMLPASLPDVLMRHYDCQTLDQWARKHLDRIEGAVIAPYMGAKRRMIAERVKQALDKGGKHELEGLYKRMFCIPANVVTSGIQQGFIIEIPPEDLNM